MQALQDAQQRFNDLVNNDVRKSLLLEALVQTSQTLTLS